MAVVQNLDRAFVERSTTRFCTTTPGSLLSVPTDRADEPPTAARNATTRRLTPSRDNWYNQYTTHP
jgi:hypothetical protein